MLHFTSIHFPSDSFEVRRLCAESLRGDVENYAPFAELKERFRRFREGGSGGNPLWRWPARKPRKHGSLKKDNQLKHPPKKTWFLGFNMWNFPGCSTLPWLFFGLVLSDEQSNRSSYIIFSYFLYMRDPWVFFAPTSCGGFLWQTLGHPKFRCEFREFVLKRFLKFSFRNYSIVWPRFLNHKAWSPFADRMWMGPTDLVSFELFCGAWNHSNLSVLSMFWIV